MKNKTALYAAIGILVLVLIGGAIIIKNSFKAMPSATEETEQTSELPAVDDSVKVDVVSSQGGKAVVVTVNGIPSGTTSIEYELSYNTGEGLPKGALGKIDVNSQSTIKKEVILGTCSRNTCTYDTGVTAVQLVLKFNNPDGAKQFTKEFNLE